MEAEMTNIGNRSNKRPHKRNSKYDDYHVDSIPKRNKGETSVENDELSSESLTEGIAGDGTINGATTSQLVSVQQTDYSLVESSTQQMNNSNGNGENATTTSQEESVGQPARSISNDDDVIINNEAANPQNDSVVQTVKNSMEPMNNSNGNGKNGAEIITQPRSIAQQVARLEANYEKMQKKGEEDAALIETLQTTVNTLQTTVAQLKTEREDDTKRINTLVAEVDKLKTQKKCGNCNGICTLDTNVWCEKCRKEELHKKGTDLSEKFVHMGQTLFGKQLKEIADEAMSAVYQPPTPPSEQTV